MSELIVSQRNVAAPSALADEVARSAASEMAEELHRRLALYNRIDPSTTSVAQVQAMLAKLYDHKVVNGENVNAFYSLNTRNQRNLYPVVLYFVMTGSNNVPADAVGQISISDVYYHYAAQDFKSIIGNQVLEAYQERLAQNASDRDEKQGELITLTNDVKLFGIVQSVIQDHISQEKAFKPREVYFKPRDFGVGTIEEMKAHPAFQRLMAQTGHPIDDFQIGIDEFIFSKGIEFKDEYSHAAMGEDGFNRQMAAFSTSVSDKAKVLNDQVNITVTELNRYSSVFNATQEAMSKFVEKLAQVMQQILHAIS